MEPITYTLENYHTLINAISQGVTSVQYGDKLVTYRSLQDMLRLRQLMRDELFPDLQNKSGATVRRVTYFNSGK